MDQVLENLDTAAVDEKLRATLRFLAKATLEPGAVGADDVRPMRKAGVSRQEAEDALSVAFFFNVITRLADAFGWRLPGQDEYDASAKFLLKLGYQMPLRGKSTAAETEA